MSPRLTDAQIDARVVVLRGIRESGHDQGCDCALCIAVALADRASRSSSGSGEAPAPDDLEIERLLDAVLDASYAVEQTEGDRTKERRAFDEARRALLQGIGKAKQEALAPWVRAAKASGSGEREAGFREGVEAAARWLVEEDAVRKPGIPAEAARVMRLLSERCASRMRCALSSAPPSPDSGDRVRALEEALRDAVDAVWWMSGADAFAETGEAHEGWVSIRGKFDRWRRALSPQGDGGTER